MKVLFDQNVPAKLARHLPVHAVTLARKMGWEELKNGDLLATAEAPCDSNLSYQQNLASRKIAIVVLPSGNWPLIQTKMLKIITAIDAAKPNSFQSIPRIISPRAPRR